jgi:hypothetical protein
MTLTLRAETHNWLQPKYKDQVKCLESLGFHFIGDVDFYCDDYGLKVSKSGSWKNTTFHCSDYDTLDAVIDGALYCLEIRQASKKRTLRNVKKRLDLAFEALPRPKQLSLL